MANHKARTYGVNCPTLTNKPLVPPLHTMMAYQSFRQQPSPLLSHSHLTSPEKKRVIDDRLMTTGSLYMTGMFIYIYARYLSFSPGTRVVIPVQYTYTWCIHTHIKIIKKQKKSTRWGSQRGLKHFLQMNYTLRMFRVSNNSQPPWSISMVSLHCFFEFRMDS